MSELAVVSVPQDRLDDLQPVWRALYEHHTALMPHLRDREVPFEQAWESRREIEGGWFESEPKSLVLAAQDARGYVGYAFVRVPPGAGFAAPCHSSPSSFTASTRTVTDRRLLFFGDSLVAGVGRRSFVGWATIPEEAATIGLPTFGGWLDWLRAEAR